MSTLSSWCQYRVRWNFVTRLCGSVPADPEMRTAWLESRAPKVRPPISRSLMEINEEVAATLLEEPVEDSEHNLLVFQRVDGACVMRASTIKAHLKDCARWISGQTGKIKGEKTFAQRVLNGVYPDPTTYWVPILSQLTGTPATETARYDKAVHVMTRMGQRSAIKTIEYLNDASMEFILRVYLNGQGKPAVSMEDLARLFDYGGVHGYAGERGDGEGRYLFTIQPLEGATA